jgi:hypothetical protein
MPEKPAPPTPTTLVEWAKTDVFRRQLDAALRDQFMIGALAVLRHMNSPKALASADLAAGALCHQFHAGWEACLRALSDLPTFDESSFTKMKRAAELEQLGAWKWASSANPATQQPTSK